MEPVHAVIVLGAPTEPDGEPGHILAERLKAAERIFRSPEAGATAPSVLVLSGGAVASYGSAATATEACVMHAYLERGCRSRCAAASGQPSDHEPVRARVVLEEVAANTMENAFESKRALAAAGLWPLVVGITVVTSDFHEERARACFEFALAGGAPRGDAQGGQPWLRVVGCPTPVNEHTRAAMDANEAKLMAEWLPQAKQHYARGAPPGACFQCGETGHFARDCPVMRL